MRARAYTPDDAASWDALVDRSSNATFLHSRRFLGYHGDRFVDASVVVTDNAGEFLGVMPAAESAADGFVVVSHPGATFGGLVHEGALHGGHAIEAFEAIAAHYRERNVTSLEYKAVPLMYQRRPQQDDLYA